MNKSIESIWKNGFIDNDAIAVPKINDLYNQKSQNLVDKFQRMFVINRKLILLAVIFLVFLPPLFGFAFLGWFIASLLIWLVVIGNRGAKELAKIDKNTNSYEYLKSFSTWRNDMLNIYSKAYSYFYPLLFIAFAIRFRFSDDAHTIITSIMDRAPNTLILFSTPWYFLMLAAIISFILFKIGSTLYKLDVNLVYGPSFKKLDELINEMEQLK